MSQKKLDLSARTALDRAHSLDNPILLAAGDYSGRYVLTHTPAKRISSASRNTKDWLKHLAAENVIENSKRNNTNSEAPHTAFSSGWAGFFYYPDTACHELSYPDASKFAERPQHGHKPEGVMAYYPCSLLLDIDSDEVWLQNPKKLDDREIQSWLEPLFIEPRLMETPLVETPYGGSDHSIKAGPQQQDWHALWNQSEYTNAFNTVQSYLKAGDCYQINLTMPFHCSSDLTNKSPYPLIKQFRPAFGGYIKTSDLTLFSVSPERFIRIEGDRIETKPIKGTLPRGATAELDQQLKNQLADSNKNKAENLMIVDLLRNDLSRSAEPHSVKVEKLFELESHANVHHLVSTISATKRADRSHLDVILDAFPGGSITGAPKKRAMEIIEELEAKPRGPYCGSMGYFDDAGHSDFNILIRTIAATKEGAECWGGGGITVDSTADDEYQEIMNKVGKILATPL